MDKPQPAYRGTEPYIFVCYAHADANVVYPELRWLQDEGIRIWYDEGISAGRVWRAEIGAAVEGAERVLFYISPESLKSDHCNREISVALDEEKVILPVYLEDTPLTPDLKIGLARLQAIHRASDSDYPRHLLAALGREAEGSRRQPQFRPREQPMIAVLPFDNLSGDAEQEFFAEGIAEDILNGLAKSRGLVVRARNSSFSFKGQRVDAETIAARLNVTHIVSGSVRRSGNRVRVTSRLTAVADDVDVWSDRYDRELIDVFTVQDEITASILNALNLHFSGTRRQRVDLDAYDAFLQARHHFGRFDIPQAISSFERAVEIEPDYAEALSHLAFMYGILDSASAFSASGRDDYSAIQTDYVERALRADPDDPTARTAASAALDPQERIRELNRLIRQYPSNPNLCFVCSAMFRTIGRSDLEVRVLGRQLTLDPLYPDAFRVRGDAKLFSGKYAEAMDDFAECERLGGARLDYYAAQVAFHRRDVEALERLVTRDPAAWGLVPQARIILSAAVPYLRGDAEGVRRSLAPLETSDDHLSNLVKFWMALLNGQNQHALVHYRTALVEREFLAHHDIQGSHGLRSLVPEYFAQPGYAAMLREFHLDSESVAKLVIPDLPF